MAILAKDASPRHNLSSRAGTGVKCMTNEAVMSAQHTGLQQKAAGKSSQAGCCAAYSLSARSACSTATSASLLSAFNAAFKLSRELLVQVLQEIGLSFATALSLPSRVRRMPNGRGQTRADSC